MVGATLFIVLVAVAAAVVIVIARYQKHLVEEILESEPKLQIPAPAVPPIPLFKTDGVIQVPAPGADAPWLYKEEDGVDLFVCGDFKIYSQGDVWVGRLCTNIKSDRLFNQLVQKFSNAALKNGLKVDPKMCVPEEPVTTPKTKKKK